MFDLKEKPQPQCCKLPGSCFLGIFCNRWTQSRFSELPQLVYRCSVLLNKPTFLRGFKSTRFGLYLMKSMVTDSTLYNTVQFAGSVTFPPSLLNNTPGVSDLIYPGKGFKCRLRQTGCEIFWGGDAAQNLNLTIITVCPSESESLHSPSGLPAPPQCDHMRATENCGFFRKQQRAPVCNKLLGPTERYVLNLMIHSYLQSFMNAVSLFASSRQDSHPPPPPPNNPQFQFVSNCR